MPFGVARPRVLAEAEEDEDPEDERMSWIGLMSATAKVRYQGTGWPWESQTGGGEEASRRLGATHSLELPA